MNNVAIAFASTIKYLGFYFDRTGTWDLHADRMCAKAVKAMGLNRSLLWQTELSIATKLKFADALIFSVLQYGQEVIATNKHIEERYQAVQSKILRRVMGQPAYT